MDTRKTTFLTVADAAGSLGVSRQRIRVLIASGRLTAVKFGRAWMIQEADLAAVRVRRPGRPRKKTNGRNLNITREK